MKRNAKSLVSRVAMAVLALVLAGCGPAAPSTSQPAEGLTAVATVFPLAWIADQVAPQAAVSFIGQGGAELHDLELSPQDRATIEQADVVLHMGAIGYQPQVEQAVGESAGQRVSVAETVGPAALITGGEEEHEHGLAVAGSPPEAAPVDPHVWFDPGAMAVVAERTGESFAAADPGSAGSYRANATALAGQLRALDAELAGLLTGCSADEAIVSHEAYAYLLQPHGLGQHGIAGVSPESGGSPAELAALSEEIRVEGMTAVLAEPVEGRADAEALAREASVALLEISPLESVDEQGYRIGYPQLLREQAATFARALGCAGSA